MSRWFKRKEINDVSYGCDDGYDRMDADFMDTQDRVRDRVGYPLNPTCAFRTYEHDRGKGRSGKGDHPKGKGIDYEITSLAQALYIIACATLEGCNAFGINLKKMFVHVGKRDQQHISTWDY